MSDEFSRSRVFFNVLGGSLTLLSVQLPWISIYNYQGLLQSSGPLAIVFYWALAGAIFSFLSRYGGIMTFVGMIAMGGEPYIASARPGLGLLIAFGGAIFTFAGLKWAVPPGLMKKRELMGGLFYTVGFLIVLTLVVGSGIYGGLFTSVGIVTAAPLFLVGIVLTGVGLKLFLSPRAREDSILARVA